MLVSRFKEGFHGVSNGSAQMVLGLMESSWNVVRKLEAEWELVLSREEVLTAVESVDIDGLEQASGLVSGDSFSMDGSCFSMVVRVALGVGLGPDDKSSFFALELEIYIVTRIDRIKHQVDLAGDLFSSIVVRLVRLDVD